MIKIDKTSTKWDIPWCYWTEVRPNETLGYEAPYEILVGEEYEPSDFKCPHIILLDRNQTVEDVPYSGDICYISVCDDPIILKGNVDKCEFDSIKKWILLNKEVIMEHWVGGWNYGSNNFYDKMKGLV